MAEPRARPSPAPLRPRAPPRRLRAPRALASGGRGSLVLGGYGYDPGDGDARRLPGVPGSAVPRLLRPPWPRGDGHDRARLRLLAPAPPRRRAPRLLLDGGLRGGGGRGEPRPRHELPLPLPEADEPD